MKAFIIAICILILITIYTFFTSAYFLRTEQHILSVINEFDVSASNEEKDTTDAKRLEDLHTFIKKRNKILSLYIYRSKCTELEFLIREMHVHLLNGDKELFKFTANRLSEVLRDIRENDALPTLSGIT